MRDAPKEFESKTTVTPLSMDVAQLVVRADYFESQIDLDLLQQDFPPAEILHADPLVLRLIGNSYVVVLSFGAVVFWKCPDAVCEVILRKMQALPGATAHHHEVRDNLLVHIGRDEDHAAFKDIGLKSLTLEHIQIVSETFGQSVALRHCQRNVDAALARTEPIVEELKTRGGLLQSAKDILKTVGFTMTVRQTILSKLTLFDDPPETWRSERIAILHHLLYEHFDIKKRLSGLQAKLTFLSDLSTILMDVLHNRGSHRLEWIVIILIVIEVVLSLLHFLPANH